MNGELAETAYKCSRFTIRQRQRCAVGDDIRHRQTDPPQLWRAAVGQHFHNIVARIGGNVWRENVPDGLPSASPTSQTQPVRLSRGSMA